MSKSNTKQQPGALDAFLQKLMEQPPTVHLMLAASMGILAYFAITQSAKFTGLITGLGALIFALMGLNSLFREMKLLKILEMESSLARLETIHMREAEIYIKALFTLLGYSLRSTQGELQREDEADLIATKKKETVVIKFNTWDDDIVSMPGVEACRRAGSTLRVDRCITITQTMFSAEAVEWSKRKGVELLTAKDLLVMAAPLIGADPDALINPAPDYDVVAEIKHEIADVAHGHHRFIFIDFAGLQTGYAKLIELLLGHPAYQLVAASLPDGHTLDTLKPLLSDCGNRLVGQLTDTPSGKYYSVQQFLKTQPQGRSTPWLALDTNPRAYPEGCTEFVAINPSFGFDHDASSRLQDAILRHDHKLAQTS